MTVKQVCMTLVLGAAAAVAGCQKDTTGVLAVIPPLAGLRYFDAVTDTGYMDMRLVDIVSYAPNSIRAQFRTGGDPMGVSNGNFSPPYLPVETGAHHIRVFLDSTDLATASKVMFDTIFTFVANAHYTFYLYGSARTPPLKAIITVDTIPTLAAGKIAVRVLDLASDLSGNAVGSAATRIDAQVGLTTSAVPIPTSGGLPAVATNLGYVQSSGYTVLNSSGTATPYRLAVTATGTTSPLLFQALMPVGVPGTDSISGTAVTGSAITAVILPRSTPGSAAPQSSPSAVSANIDSVTRSNDTVTVWRLITPGDGSTTCAKPVAAGAAVNNILTVSGLGQPEYNGSHTVVFVKAGKSQTALSQQTITLSNTSAGAAYSLILNPGGTAADTTLPINWDADSATVRAALAARSAIGGSDNIDVAGPVGGPYTITFLGALANTSVATMAAVATPATFTVVIAKLPVLCTGTATPSFFQYRIGATPVSPATGAASYKIVTSTNEFKAPTIFFMIDR